MILKSQNILCSVVLLFLLVLPTSEIEAQTEGGKSGRGFTIVAWKALPYKSLYYRSGKKMLPLEVKPGRRSEFYSLPEATKLQIYTLEKDPEGKNKYKILGQEKILAKAKRMLFVIVPNKNTSLESELSLFGINDSFDVFPVGSFRFLNFTSIPLEVDFNRQRARLKSGGTKVVKLNVPKSGNFFPFYIKTNKGKVIFETRLLGQPSGREIVFIAPPSNKSGRVSVKFLPHSVIPAPVAQSTNNE